MIVLRIPGGASADTLNQIKQCAQHFPGPHTLRLDVETREGVRMVTLGHEWAVDGSEACLVALEEYGGVPSAGSPSAREAS